MAEIRPKKDSDQAEISKAIELIFETVELNPGIENNNWHAACLRIFVNSYADNGVTYEQFCGELERIRDFYKNLWED